MRKSLLPLWLVYNIIWTCIYASIIFLLLLTYLHFQAKRMRLHYTRQGIAEMPGCETFFVGNTL